MATRPVPQPSTKLLTIQKDFQQLASMAGFLNSALDLPQLRLFFTLYGRLRVASEAEGLAITPRLAAWAGRLSTRLREDSSAAIQAPQVSIGLPQLLPAGDGYYLLASLTFNSKVSENGYQRVRAAVLSAYQAAVALREKGDFGEESPAPEA